MSFFNLSTGAQSAPSVISVTNAQNPALSVSQNGGGAVANFVTGSNTAMVINNAGYVGIGTTNPQASLHVNGNIISNSYSFYVYGSSTNIGSTGGTVSNGVATTTEAKCTFNTILTNNNNCYNTSTGLFTAPINGIYYFSYSLFIFTVNSSPTISYADSWMVLSTSGSMLFGYDRAPGFNWGINRFEMHPKGTAIIYMTSGSTIYVKTYVSTSVANDLISTGNDSRMYFTGTLLQAL